MERAMPPYPQAEQELMAQNLRAAREWVSSRQDVLLHVTDTEYAYYPYYDELFRTVRPAMLVHTGDLADEYKAGRREEDRAPWTASVPLMLGCMRRSGAARLVICPGNNDLPDTLAALAPDMEIVPRNTVLSFSGMTFAVCHEIHLIDTDAPMVLYGHGFTGEPYPRSILRQDGRRYYNAMWGVTLFCPATGESLLLDRPEQDPKKPT